MSINPEVPMACAFESSDDKTRQTLNPSQVDGLVWLYSFRMRNR